VQNKALRQTAGATKSTPITSILSGFGGLEVSVLAFGTPGRSRRIFRAKNPQRAFLRRGSKAHVVNLRRVKEPKSGSRHFRQNSRQILAHSSTFRYWGSLASFQTLGTPCGKSSNVLKSLVLQVGGLTCRWQRHSVKTSLLRILNDS